MLKRYFLNVVILFSAMGLFSMDMALACGHKKHRPSCSCDNNRYLGYRESNLQGYYHQNMGYGGLQPIRWNQGGYGGGYGYGGYGGGWGMEAGYGGYQGGGWSNYGYQDYYDSWSRQQSVCGLYSSPWDSYGYGYGYGGGYGGYDFSFGLDVSLGFGAY